MARLGDICTVVSGSTPKTNIPEYWDGDVKWITPAELNEDSCYLFDSQRHISELGKEKTGLSYMPAGTIILSSRAPIGKTAIAGCELCCNQGFKNLICSDAIFNEYLYFFLKSKTDYLNSLGRGATFKEISKSIVENIEIRLPSLEEQKKAAKQLGHIYHLISLRKQQLAKLDELVKARFVELFNGKYDTVKIGDVFSTTSGGTPSKSHPEYYENGTIPWLSSGEVNIGVIHSVKNYITQEGVDNSSAKMVPENSVVIAMYGATAGQVGLLRIATTTNQAVCSVLPDNRYVPEYLYYAIKSKKDWMISQCAGGAQPNISQGVIKRMEIIDAPYELQKQFASFVEQTDKSKLTVQQSLDKLELLKKALMHKYFG